MISVIAVFMALGGGAYAIKLKSNSVGTKQLKPNVVNGAKGRRRFAQRLPP